jgi:hypothetical protein
MLSAMGKQYDRDDSLERSSPPVNNWQKLDIRHYLIFEMDPHQNREYCGASAKSARPESSPTATRSRDRAVYGIWCEVSGGVTGHRASWLKVEGIIQRYDTFGEATAIAADLQRKANGSYATASFHYEPREIEPYA